MLFLFLSPLSLSLSVSVSLSLCLPLSVAQPHELTHVEWANAACVRVDLVKLKGSDARLIRKTIKLNPAMGAKSQEDAYLKQVC